MPEVLRFCGIAENFATRYDQKWPKTELTWHHGSRFHHATVEAALKVWADASTLTFTYDPSDPDLRFSLVPREHGDGHPFDGPGGRLAHAFLPDFYLDFGLEGQAHFDESEDWGVGDNHTARFDLLTVLIHEIGHLLGLGHSQEPGSVMYPFYYRMSRILAPDDVDGIQALYGAPPRELAQGDYVIYERTSPIMGWTPRAQALVEAVAKGDIRGLTWEYWRGELYPTIQVLDKDFPR